MQVRNKIQSCLKDEKGKIRINDRSDPVTNLNDLPYPDFEDYFYQMKSSSLSNSLVPCLQIESSYTNMCTR